MIDKVLISLSGLFIAISIYFLFAEEDENTTHRNE